MPGIMRYGTLTEIKKENEKNETIIEYIFMVYAVFLNRVKVIQFLSISQLKLKYRHYIPPRKANFHPIERSSFLHCFPSINKASSTGSCQYFKIQRK